MNTQYITGSLRLISFSVPISPACDKTELSTLMISRISDLDCLWQFWNTFGNICVLRSLINPRDSYRNVHRLTPIGNTTSNFLNHPILYLLPFEWLFSRFFWLLEHKNVLSILKSSKNIIDIIILVFLILQIRTSGRFLFLIVLLVFTNHRPLPHIYPPKRFFLPFTNPYFSYVGYLTNRRQWS